METFSKENFLSASLPIDAVHSPLVQLYLWGIWDWVVRVSKMGIQSNGDKTVGGQVGNGTWGLDPAVTLDPSPISWEAGYSCCLLEFADQNRPIRATATLPGEWKTFPLSGGNLFQHKLGLHCLFTICLERS